MTDRPGFERILLAVSPSPHSLAAVPLVVRLAAVANALVLVLHIWSPDEPTFDHRRRGLTVIEVEELLDRVLRQFRADRVHAVGETPTALSDRVPALVTARADSFRADLVVVGNPGPSELHSIFGAGRTHRLVAMSNRPVLAVGSDVRRWIGTPRRVLAVIGDESDAASLVRAVIDVTGPASANVEMMHFSSGSTTLLDLIAGQLKSSGLNVSCIGADATRDPADQIVEAANRTESDVIVIASDRTSPGSLLPGDVAHRLLGAAPCAVLVVPPWTGPTGRGRLVSSSVTDPEQRSA